MRFNQFLGCLSSQTVLHNRSQCTRSILALICGPPATSFRTTPDPRMKRKTRHRLDSLYYLNESTRIAIHFPQLTQLHGRARCGQPGTRVEYRQRRPFDRPNECRKRKSTIKTNNRQSLNRN